MGLSGSTKVEIPLVKRLDCDQDDLHTSFLSFRHPYPEVLISPKQIDVGNGPLDRQRDKVAYDAQINALLPMARETAEPELHPWEIRNLKLLCGWDQVTRPVIPVRAKMLSAAALGGEIDKRMRHPRRIKYDIAPVSSIEQQFPGCREQISGIDENAKTVHPSPS